jgi:hypothetical protein
MKPATRSPGNQGNLASLVTGWREEAVVLRRRGAVAHADVLESVAEELETALSLALDATVSLRQAAELSGYTPDGLSRLVRQGALENCGRLRAPRFRVSDLPKKTGQLRRRNPVGTVVDARQGTGSVTEEGA